MDCHSDDLLPCEPESLVFYRTSGDAQRQLELIYNQTAPPPEGVGGVARLRIRGVI